MTMNYLDFTAEETNLIAIYATKSRAETIARITEALPYMDEAMRDIALRSVEKLTAMSDDEFDETVFASDDDTEGEDTHADHTQTER
jgi:hypothetical protein